MKISSSLEIFKILKFFKIWALREESLLFEVFDIEMFEIPFQTSSRERKSPADSDDFLALLGRA